MVAKTKDAGTFVLFVPLGALQMSCAGSAGLPAAPAAHEQTADALFGTSDPVSDVPWQQERGTSCGHRQWFQAGRIRQWQRCRKHPYPSYDTDGSRIYKFPRPNHLAFTDQEEPLTCDNTSIAPISQSDRLDLPRSVPDRGRNPKSDANDRRRSIAPQILARPAAYKADDDCVEYLIANAIKTMS